MSVPNLPGFRSNRTAPKARPQNFTITRDGVCVERKTRVAPAAPADDSMRFTRTSALEDTRFGESKRAAAREEVAPPAFVALDRQVLRLYAYFKEAVVESAAEAQRVRKVTIQYYLVDGTIMVLEHKQENSGIPQGTFIKRHRIPGGSGMDGCYNFEDLLIGSEVTFYGRTMRIYDCDAFTRGFYESQGCDLGPAEEIPSDDHTALRSTMVVTADGTFGKLNNPLKKFMEASLGKVAAGRGEAENLTQFLTNDRKVLRFFATWDDTKRLYGDKNAYVVNFFLADDTVEVREVHVVNSGRDHFPALLGRQKLPKDWKKDFGNDAARGVEDDPPPETYVQPGDLRIGGTVDVFGRTLNILACDAFTRKWYATKGYSQPANIQPPTATRETKALPVPPYTGFGEDEDSLASFYNLVPKVPKKDFNKFMKNDRKVLRFSARLARACPEDRHRNFIIQLYLADDTLAIYEPATRNSGIVGGKFLNRAKYKKDNGEVYTAADFVPNTEIEIYKRRFLIVDADEYTKGLVPEVIPGTHKAPAGAGDAAAEEVLQRIREAARRRGAHGIHQIGRTFKIMDDNGDRGLDRADLATGLADYGCKLSEDELDTLVYTLDKDGSGKVDFNEFLNALRGPMNHRRLALCHAAFDILDKTGDNYVKLDDIVELYDFSQNEKVLSGQQSVMQAAEEFMQQWDTLKDDGIVTRQEFVEYCKGVSANIDSDDYFQLMMKKAWRI